MIAAFDGTLGTEFEAKEDFIGLRTGLAGDLASLVALADPFASNFFAAVGVGFAPAFFVGVVTAFFFAATFGATVFFFDSDAFTEDFFAGGVAADFWRGKFLADVLLSFLEGRFGVAVGDVRRDFVDLESCSLIVQTLSIKEKYLCQPLGYNLANSDKSIINNRLARLCQFSSEKYLRNVILTPISPRKLL